MDSAQLLSITGRDGFTSVLEIAVFRLTILVKST